MLKRKHIIACALPLALLVAPVSSSLFAVTRHRAPSAAVQDGDVPSNAEQAMFTRGQTYFTQGRYDQAAVVLREFLQTYPKSLITDLTLLWLGRSYIELNRIPEAESVEQRLRQIGDTPFLDIYQNELGDARRKSATLARQTPPAATPQVAAPAPSPTPRQIARNTNPETNPNITPTNTSPRPTSSPQTRIITAAPPNTGLISSSRPRRGERRTPDIANPSVTPPIASVPEGSSPRRPSERRSTPTPRPSPTPVPDSIAANTPPRENPAPTETAPPTATTNIGAGNVGGLSVTVRQVPDLLLALRTPTITASPSQTISIPLVVTNRGNKEDQFRLTTDLPAEYQPTFSLASQVSSDTGLPILVTPQVARGANVEVVLNVRVPETAIDGQQNRFLVRAASQSDFQIMKVADAALNVTAAALSATASVSQPSVLPGETFDQTIAIRNQGSAASRSTRADFVFDPDFELVSANPAPLVYDRASRTAIWDLREMGARDSREITVRLRAVGDALAASKNLGRGTLRTSSLPVPSNFDGPGISVGRVTKARIDSVSTGLTATPGDTIYVPFVVRNPSNYKEAYELRITAPGAPGATAYADTNSDGQHQDGEPVITRTAEIEPRDGQFPILLRVDIPRSTPDRQQFAYNVVARSISDGRAANEGSTVLTVAAPRVRVRTEQVSDTAAGGDTIFYRLVLINEGAGLAKNLVVTEQLPDALQFVAADPDLKAEDAPGGAQRLQWRVTELAPGDTAVLKITARLRPNLAEGTSIVNRTNLSYQDTNSNAYQGQ